MYPGISETARPPVAGVDWPRSDVPLAFLEMACAGGGGEEKEGESKLNRGEAERIMELLHAVLSAGELSASDVGIITPYVAQVRMHTSMHLVPVPCACVLS